MAKSTFAIERSRTADGNHIATIVDKKTGHPALYAESTNKTPARALLTALHGQMVEKARKNGQVIPGHVEHALRENVKKIRIETQLRNDPAYNAGVPVVRIDANAKPAEVAATKKAVTAMTGDAPQAVASKTGITLSEAVRNGNGTEAAALGKGIAMVRDVSNSNVQDQNKNRSRKGRDQGMGH